MQKLHSWFPHKNGAYLIAFLCLSIGIYLFGIPKLTRSEAGLEPDFMGALLVEDDDSDKDDSAPPDYSDHHDLTINELEALLKDMEPYVPSSRETRAVFDGHIGGEWGDVIDWPHIPVSVANLPDGRLLTWASNEKLGFEDNLNPERTFTATWDPLTNEFVEIMHESHDLFCAHQVMLEDGSVFVNGGRNFEESIWTSTFDFKTNRWEQKENMTFGRWYPTSIFMPGDQVFTALGSNGERYAELYTPGAGWEVKTGINMQSMIDYKGEYTRPDWWPQMALAPTGDILHFGPTPQMHWINPSGNGSMVPIENVGIAGWDSGNQAGMHIFYDEGKLLVMGGRNDTVGDRKYLKIDMNGETPTVSNMTLPRFTRQFANAVVLPTGEVLMIGGSTSAGGFNDTENVFIPEIWDPTTDTWRELNPMSIPRNYHSTAILLPDGRVFSGGGGLCGDCPFNHPDAQIFSPPYLFDPDGSLKDRPEITQSPESTLLGETIEVEGSDSIKRFTMIRLSSTTHSVNTDLRFLDIPFEKLESGEYQLTMHDNINVMLPGYWMLFALDADGTPSESQTIHISSEGIIEEPETPEETVASYYEDFETPDPKQGWQYLWNSKGTIGRSENYEPLKWNGSHYDSDGEPGLPDESDLFYGHLGDSYGHPGRGAIQGQESDRFVIAGYTVQVVGQYSIKESYVIDKSTHIECGNNGIQIRVYVNDQLVLDRSYQNGSRGSFDAFLGQLEAFDTIYIALGPDGLDYCDAFEWDFSISRLPTEVDYLNTIANFRDDYFDETPKEGWEYQWNNFGEIGDQANYTPLLWNGEFYDSDGILGSPDGTDFNYGFIDDVGGHTGYGINQGQSQEPRQNRYAIASYTVPFESEYWIVNSYIFDAKEGYSDGVNVRVYVNDRLISEASYEDEGATTFNGSLGILNPGDTIHVAAGPRGSDSRDKFYWDFTIVGEPDASNLTVQPIVAAPAEVNQAITYTADAAGEGLKYQWVFGDGTPETEFTDSPFVTHTFADPNRYLVSLNVEDENGATKRINFTQAIYGKQTPNKPVSSMSVIVDGNNRIWNVNPDNSSVSVFDVINEQKLAEIEVGAEPRSLALAPDGRVWVANKGSASISIIDPNSMAVDRLINLPDGSQPYGVAFSPNKLSAYVVLEATGRLLKLHPVSGAILGETDVGPKPRHLAIIADSERVYVSRFVTPVVPGEGTANPMVEDRGGEVVVVLAETMTVEKIVVLRHSNAPDAERGGRGLPNYLGAPVVSPDGASIWVPSKQDNILRGVLRDGLDLDHDNTVRAITSMISTSNGQVENYGARVDHDDASVASAAAYGPYGNYLFVALEGNREVSVVDAYAHQEIGRFDVGFAPQGLALSNDGTTLFVHNFMDRTVSAHDISTIINSGTLKVIDSGIFKAVENEVLDPIDLRGKRLFYDARDERLSKESYMSCASCHNGGEGDGRIWDMTGFGEGLRNTISLEGHGNQELLHWSGNFDEVHDFEQQIRKLAGGKGLMDDEDFESSKDPLGIPKAGISLDLDALAAYVNSLDAAPQSPYRGENQKLTELGRAGRAVFLASGCASCHSGDRFTDSGSGARHDVGTLKPSSGQRLDGPLDGLQTPTLLGIWKTAPYLHDGSADSLADAVNAHDGIELSGDSLANLVVYLRQIDEQEAGTPNSNGTSIYLPLIRR